MAIFRKTAPQEPLIVAMSGVQLGLRVLVLVADDVEMPVDVAAKVGLSGRAIASSPHEEVLARLGTRAARRGVLVETAGMPTPLPFQEHAFDLVIADDRRRPGGLVTQDGRAADLLRVLRPGGRLVVLLAAPSRNPLLAWRGTPPRAEGTREVEEHLVAAGFRAAREVGTRNGTTFVEAVRSS